MVLCLAIIVVVASGASLTHLVKDTSVKAFIPAGHEALRTDAAAAETFGLSDTIAIAVTTTDGGAIFRPQSFGPKRQHTHAKHHSWRSVIVTKILLPLPCLTRYIPSLSKKLRLFS